MGEDESHGWRVPWRLWPRWLGGVFILSILLIGVGGCRASMEKPLTDPEFLAMQVIACVTGGLLLIVGSWQGRWHTRRIPADRRRLLLVSRAIDTFGLVLAAGTLLLAVFLVVSATIE